MRTTVPSRFWAGLALASMSWPVAAGEAPVAAPSLFQLNVEEKDGKWNIRWDSQSALIRKARLGQIEIVEGNERAELVPLDLQQLSRGFLQYGSTGHPLHFRLAVIDASGKIEKEEFPRLPSATPPPSAAAAPSAPAERAPVLQEVPALPPPILAPRAPPLEPPPLVVDEKTQAGKLVRAVPPDYPAAALRAKIEGDVRFVGWIAKDGSIRELTLSGGDPALVPAATEAVKHWMYRPTLVNGIPVEVLTQIDVRFSLR